MTPSRAWWCSGRVVRLALAFMLAAAGIAVACSRTVHETDAVHMATFDDQVNPVTERYVDRVIDEAERTNAKAVVIELNTPGGLVSSMEDIVQRIRTSEVPVIVWVGPAGAKAASAGTFITMSAHVAAMAPSTRIGAAHPVSATGGDIEGDLGDKVENDAAAFARSIAADRGRNVDWAEDAVRQSVSATADEAVELDVVDYVARDIDDLLAQAEGRTISMNGSSVVLTGLEAAPRADNDLTFFERVLLVLSDPNIAFLLLSLGGLGLVLELLNPGTFIPGTVGIIALVLGLFAVGTLPVNWAGVALILLAFALFAGEFLVTGFGALGVGGIIALAAGGLILTSSSDPEFQVSRWLVVGVAVVLGGSIISITMAIIKTRRAPAPHGTLAMIGNKAIARTDLTPDGFVFVEGARWKAVAGDADTPISRGESVVITGVKGLTLFVARKATLMEQEAAEPSSTPEPPSTVTRERFPPAISS